MGPPELAFCQGHGTTVLPADSSCRRNSAGGWVAVQASISLLMRSDGRCQPSVFRGRSLISAATSASRSALWMERSVPFGKYCRSSPFIFSLEPRSHGEWAWQKEYWRSGHIRDEALRGQFFALVPG